MGNVTQASEQRSGVEEQATITANGIGTPEATGVERRVPPEPIRTTRTLLPLSWMKRTVELTLLDGESVRGTLLDLCPAGPILRVRLSRTEACRRVVSWDALRYVDLLEGS